MERTASAVIRASVHTYLKNYLYFNTVTILILLPFSASVLLSSSSSSTTTTVLPLRGLGTTIPTTSVSRVVFTLTFLLMAKSSIIRSLCKHPQDPIFPSFFQLYGTLLKTQILNTIFTITADTTTFVLFTIACRSSSKLFGFGFPPDGTLVPAIWTAISYAITTNLSVLNNLSLVITGNGDCSAIAAISRACDLRRRGEPGILVPAAFANLGFVGVEALFRRRVMIWDYEEESGMPGWGMMIWEGFLTSYMYSVVVVLDMVACCLVLRQLREDEDEDADDDGFRKELGVV